MRQGMILIVSGPPAAGKTTLAAKLGAALGWPVFGKDAIKESLFDTLGARDRAWSRTVGHAAMMVLFDLLAIEMAAGRSVIAEANFNVDYDAAHFAALVDKYGCALREVFVTAAPEVILRRFFARWERGERHPGHGQETEQEAELRERLYVTRIHRPIVAPPHLLTVDTSDFAAVDDAAIIAASRRLVKA